MVDVEYSIDEDSVDADVPAPPRTILAELTAAVQKEVELPEVRIDVKERPGVSVTYSPNVDSNELKSWRSKSTNKKTGELDSIKFSCLVLGNTMTGIWMNEEEVFDETGNPIEFMSTTFAEMMQVALAQVNPHAIRKFYGVDAHLESTALAVLDHAGYGDEIETEENPTKQS